MDLLQLLLVLAVVAIVIGVANWLKDDAPKLVQAIINRVVDRLARNKIPGLFTRNVPVLILGRGTVGKTQLIEQIAYEDTIEVFLRTEDVSVTLWKPQLRDGVGLKIALGDYRGQDIGQIPRLLMGNGHKNHSHLRVGKIVTIIIVVDLFPMETVREERRKQYADINVAHVSEQLSSWDRDLLDLMFGLLPSPPLKSVGLFVNKVDKWRTNLSREEVRSEAMRLFDPLSSELEKRCSNAKPPIEFRVFTGSALTGDGVEGGSGLKSWLLAQARTTAPRG